VTAADIHRTIDAVWRIEAAKLIAALTRIVRDVGIAEDLAQDALVAALQQWPDEGIPDKPGAWLMTIAKHRAIDLIRRNVLFERKQADLVRDVEVDFEEPEVIEDDLLRLIFIACHPILATEARVALTLRLLGGLTTDEIARAFLVPEPTVAQRIVRAKRALSEAHVPFEVPKDLANRLGSVLEVIYLIYNEGYSTIRPSLCEDALRLGRILAELVPHESEVHGLIALMEIQASRFAARLGEKGQIIPLLEQDRGRWDHVFIGRGLAALARAGENAHGPYTLQAAIAACHARARTPEETDWERIASLYEMLAEITQSPVVELNRAVAVGMARGPAAGLELIDPLMSEPALRSYHLLPAARGDLLSRLGRNDEARTEFERAASLTTNERERELLLQRAAKPEVYSRR
jgi:RNA polymerase sigma factor (sigma-70 family)